MYCSEQCTQGPGAVALQGLGPQALCRAVHSGAEPCSSSRARELVRAAGSDHIQTDQIRSSGGSSSVPFLHPPPGEGRWLWRLRIPAIRSTGWGQADMLEN